MFAARYALITLNKLTQFALQADTVTELKTNWTCLAGISRRASFTSITTLLTASYIRIHEVTVITGTLQCGFVFKRVLLALQALLMVITLEAPGSAVDAGVTLDGLTVLTLHAECLTK